MQHIETRTELELLLKDEQALLIEIAEEEKILADLKSDLEDIRRKIQMEKDQKNPKEASNIFHSIMKASVKPVKADKDEKEVKPDTKPKK